MPEAVLVFTGVVVFAQMFDVGLRFQPGSLARLLRDTGLLIRALGSVLVVVPLMVFIAIALVPVPPEVALGLVLLAAAPGAPLTTRRSEAAGADRGFVSALQVCLALLAMVHMPLVLAAFSELKLMALPAVAPEKVALQVATVTFVPLVLGRLVALAASEPLRRKADWLSLFSRLLFFAFLLAVVLAVAFLPDLRAKLLVGWPAAMVLLALAALSLLSGHLLGGPVTERRSGLAIATVARNLGLALYVAESSDLTVGAIPTILTYAVLSIALAMPYSRVMKARGGAAA